MKSSAIDFCTAQIFPKHHLLIGTPIAWGMFAVISRVSRAVILSLQRPRVGGRSLKYDESWTELRCFTYTYWMQWRWSKMRFGFIFSPSDNLYLTIQHLWNCCWKLHTLCWPWLSKLCASVFMYVFVSGTIKRYLEAPDLWLYYYSLATLGGGLENLLFS